MLIAVKFNILQSNNISSFSLDALLLIVLGSSSNFTRIKSLTYMHCFVIRPYESTSLQWCCFFFYLLEFTRNGGLESISGLSHSICKYLYYETLRQGPYKDICIALTNDEQGKVHTKFKDHLVCKKSNANYPTKRSTRNTNLSLLVIRKFSVNISHFVWWYKAASKYK